jgi:hypothetical protein
MNPTHPSLNSREHQLQTIDAQIKFLEDSIRALRHQRNALAPVSSLPTEIITIIFSFLPHMLSAISPHKKRDPLVWLRVSHVCHQWRDIALNQPVFWSHVDFTNISSEGAAEILARAKTVPLYLEARGLGSYRDNTQFSAFQEEVRSCVSRILHLLISAKPSIFASPFMHLYHPLPPSIVSRCQARENVVLPETLFGGKMPSLSTLELINCDISWESSLLKGLQCLEMRSLSANARPSLPVWLDALNEMQQLKALTLHSASPIAPPIDPVVEVERTVTHPFLTHLHISANNCALVLAHLDLPALTWLCVEAIVHFPHDNDMQNLLPYVVRHAHGPQDTQPLQSALVFEKGKYIDILAWTMPNIDDDVHDSLALLPTTLPARVALSLTSKEGWYTLGPGIETLPLDDLVTLIVKDSMSSLHLREVSPPSSPKWPLLRRVRLAGDDVFCFLDWLREDEGGCENPLLPSLKELVLVDCYLYDNVTLCLRDALIKRVEQGVPLEMLDLRTCCPDSSYPAAVRMLSEIVVDVLGPEETVDARSQIISIWDGLSPFVGHENSDYDDLDTGPDDEGEDDEE